MVGFDAAPSGKILAEVAQIRRLCPEDMLTTIGTFPPQFKIRRFGRLWINKTDATACFSWVDTRCA